MITCDEFIKAKRAPLAAWLNGFDLMRHVLKADVTATRHKDTDPAEECLQEVLREIGVKDTREAKKFTDALETTYAPKLRATEITMPDGGDLNIDRYIDADPEPYDDCILTPRNTEAITIVIDANLSAVARGSGYIEEQHAAAYKIALEAESEGRPCRIIVAQAKTYPELWQEYPGDKEAILRLYIVIKDYADYITPALWNVWKTSDSANSMGNVISDYLIGTHASGNCSMRNFNVAHDIDEEVILNDPKRLSFKPEALRQGRR